VNWLPILGVLVVVVGLVLGKKFKLNPLLAVLAGGFVSGLLGGIPFLEIVKTIGDAFVKQRAMILFLIMLPAIGITEKHGLMNQMAHLISKIHAATPGRISYLFQLVRALTVTLGIRLSGHAAFLRPLITPMALASYESRGGDMEDEKKTDLIKGMTAASENFGNFFAQNVFPAAAGLLLIQGVLEELGHPVELVALAKAAIPVAVISAIYGFVYFCFVLDRKIAGGDR
jgi:uncharacterized membrane protein